VDAYFIFVIKGGKMNPAMLRLKLNFQLLGEMVTGEGNADHWGEQIEIALTNPVATNKTFWWEYQQTHPELKGN